MYEWSLDVLYEGLDSKKFQDDFASVTPLVDKINCFAQSLANVEDKKTALLEAIALLEENTSLVGDLGVYLSLRSSTNTTDSKVAAYISQLQQKTSMMSKSVAIINKFIAGIDNLEAMIESDEKLSEYRFMLLETKNQASHLLSDEVEEAIAKLNLSAGAAWSNMQRYLTSTLKVDYKGENTTLSGIRNLAYSESKEERKAAYEAELAAYDKISDAVSFSLNNIKIQVNTLCEMKGYESPLDLTLQDSRMQRSTLEAMLQAMEKHLPKFHAYMRRKAEMLGYENGLPWFELFAPMGKSSAKFTPETAHEYLVSHFKTFSDDLAEMVDTAFKENWIDFFPRMGKVGGAFCYNLPAHKQSRVLTNFDGALGDVVTLAHELGHAYHGMHIENHLPLNTDYSMPVAETASTFNENLIMNAAIAETEDKAEKLALIESQLQDLNQIICDIYSRYLFETAVFEGSKNGFMFADELNEAMLKAQKTAYGNGLDPQYMNQYMWICKSHYYSEHLSFYNFPYAFGGLFARGLYAKFKAEGKTFVPKYQQLLHATTISSVEDVAKICDIDLSQPSFWEEALLSCEELIDQFIELSHQI